MSYNGWANYETWCVNLWLANDEGTYHDMRDSVLVGHDRSNLHAAGQSIREYVESLEPAASVLSGASFVSDLLGAALSEVVWEDIADGWLEDDEDEDDDEEAV